MAGTILVSEGAGLPLSSASFDHLVEEIRLSMASPAGAEFANAYRPYDHEGMMFVDLRELSVEAFSAFVAATRSAALTCALSHGTAFEGVWSGLAQALAKGPRFLGVEQGSQALLGTPFFSMAPRWTRSSVTTEIRLSSHLPLQAANTTSFKPIVWRSQNGNGQDSRLTELK